MSKIVYNIDMISFIKGEVQNKTTTAKESYIDILTSGGVGYKICIPSTYLTPRLGEEYSLFTHFHVREDTQALYGFQTEEEREFFGQLIQVSGVGPKIGMAILSTYSRKELEMIIEEGDAKSLSKTPGLGMKRAQKVIIELRGIIDLTKESTEDSLILKDLKDALKALGFDSKAIKEKAELAEKILLKEKDIDIGELIKKVIKE